MKNISADVARALERIKPAEFDDSGINTVLADREQRETIRLAGIPLEYRTAVKDVMEKRQPDGTMFRDFRRHWHNGAKRIWLCGPKGCGKSTAMAWAAIKAIQSDKWVCWFNADLAEHYCEQTKKKIVQRDLFSEAMDAPVCCIDDAHKTSSLWANIQTRIGAIINHRYQAGLPVYVASIAPPEIVALSLGDDIIDRFPCVIRGGGPSMRGREQGVI